MSERNVSAQTDIHENHAGALTNRPATLLAQAYGYADLGGLIDDLPEGANVLDAGAGCSNLGETVSLARDDITWVNLDVRYAQDSRWFKREGMLRRYLQIYELDGPSNLSLVGESIDRLPELFPEGHFDRTFSFYMLPYIAATSAEAGQRAVRYMLEATASERKASFGPLRWINPGVIEPTENGLGEHIKCHDDGSSRWDGTVTATLPIDRSLIPDLASLVADHVRL